MTLAGTGYEVALVCKLARLKLPLAVITEARIPGSGTRHVERATLLYSGGDCYMHGVTLVAHPPFSHALFSWQPVSGRLFMARFIHRHGHLTVIAAYAPTAPSARATP